MGDIREDDRSPDLISKSARALTSTWQTESSPHNIWLPQNSTPLETYGFPYVLCRSPGKKIPRCCRVSAPYPNSSLPLCGFGHNCENENRDPHAPFSTLHDAIL